VKRRYKLRGWIIPGALALMAAALCGRGDPARATVRPYLLRRRAPDGVESLVSQAGAAPSQEIPGPRAAPGRASDILQLVGSPGELDSDDYVSCLTSYGN